MPSGAAFTDAGFEEIVIPSIWETDTFIEKAGGSEILDQMFAFKDKAERSICLIPEVTGVIQELFRRGDLRPGSNPNYLRKLFYVSRCYRYERPQRGRQREFTQLGVEIVSTDTEPASKARDKAECVALLQQFLDRLGVDYRFVGSVKRGLTYYVENGFEVECDTLGSQKQIAGGGTYREGVGFAIGLERLLLAMEG